MGTVYLIHFDRPIGNPNNPRGHAQHYIGYSDNLAERLLDHAKGQGSAIMAYLAQTGIGWLVTRTWMGGRTFERKLKNRKNAKAICPICQCKGINNGLHKSTKVSDP
jgi:hypothetical protein